MDTAASVTGGPTALGLLLQRTATLPTGVLAIILRDLPVVELARLSCVHKNLHRAWQSLQVQHPGRYAPPSASVALEMVDFCRLVHAAATGDLAVLQAMLDSHGDVTCTAKPAAMIAAARYGHVQAVGQLLRCFVQYDDDNGSANESLRIAAEHGHLDVVQHLINWGAHVHADEGAALRQASKNGHTNVVQLLLQNLMQHGRAGLDKALQFAAERGHADVAQLLIQHGADVNTSGNDGCRAISWASHEGHADVVKVLLQHGADVNADGGEALDWACEEGHTAVVQLLLQHGADAHGHHGNSPALQGASKFGRADVVQLLIQHGANVNAGAGGALREASKHGHTDIVQLLIHHGADVVTLGVKALCYAADHGHSDVVRLLIEHGADVHVGDDKALRVACLQRNVDNLHRLFRNGANVHAGDDEALRGASNRGHIGRAIPHPARGKRACTGRWRFAEGIKVWPRRRCAAPHPAWG